jgi:hypothetical protein
MAGNTDNLSGTVQRRTDLFSNGTSTKTQKTVTNFQEPVNGRRVTRINKNNQRKSASISGSLCFCAKPFGWEDKNKSSLESSDFGCETGKK